MNGEHFGSEKSNQSYRKHLHKIQTKEAKLQTNQKFIRDPLSVTGECAKCLVHHGCSEYSQPVKKYRKYRSITIKTKTLSYKKREGVYHKALDAIKMPLAYP